MNKSRGMAVRQLALVLAITVVALSHGDRICGVAAPLEPRTGGVESSGDTGGLFTPDLDRDGIEDAADNCPFAPNPNQDDDNSCDDGDVIGDACECPCRGVRAAASESCAVCEPLWLGSRTNANPHEGKIDVVFVRDGSPSDPSEPFTPLDEFRRDVFVLIDAGLRRNPQLGVELGRYNFYVATDAVRPGDAERLDDGLDPGRGDCAWRDISVIVHARAGFAERALSRSWMTEPAGGQVGVATVAEPGVDLDSRLLGTFVHQLAHALFGLADEHPEARRPYLGPNVYCTAAECENALLRKNLLTPLACNGFTASGSDADDGTTWPCSAGDQDGWWSYDASATEGCVMASYTAPERDFGPDCRNRIEAVHRSYLSDP